VAHGGTNTKAEAGRHRRKTW